MRRAGLAVVLFAASSCGGGSRAMVLANGAVLHVGPGGALRVDAADHTLFEIARGHALLATTYDEQVMEIWGSYGFTRDNVAHVPLDRLVDVMRDGDDVLLRYEDASGAVAGTLRVVPERPDSTRLVVEVSGLAGLDAITFPTDCAPGNTYTGFGSQTTGLDQRGEAFGLFVEEQGIGRHGYFLQAGNLHTSYFPVPYYLDARGFGVVLDTDRRVEVDLCQTDPAVASLRVESPGLADVVLLHGPTPKSVITQLGDRYGRPTAPPDWVYEPWIGVQGGQTEVLAEADALDAAGVPWSTLWVQDWVGFLDIGLDFKDIQYHWNVDPTRYPDLPGLTQTLHGRGKRFLGYINAFVEEAREHYAPMAQMGLLIEDPSGAPFLFSTLKGPTSLPDLTNPAARAYVGTYVAAMIDTFGMDGWMADFGEWLPLGSVPFDGSEIHEAHNRYPMAWQQLNHGIARQRRGNDYAIFTRSGWLGSQGTTQIVWLGDQEADWKPTDGIPTVVPMLLNLGLSGVPFTTPDVAGYSGGPSTEELFMRWTELGAFTPILRTHEGLKALINVKWDTSPTVMAHFRRFARIHVALGPTFRALASEAAATSIPITRALFLEYPDDPNAVRASDEFLVGTELLVAPVTVEGATSREVYFPRGTWFHVLRAGESYVGPGTFPVDAPLGEPPVFSRGAERADLRAIQ